MIFSGLRESVDGRHLIIKETRRQKGSQKNNGKTGCVRVAGKNETPSIFELPSSLQRLWSEDIYISERDRYPKPSQVLQVNLISALLLYLLLSNFINAILKRKGNKQSDSLSPKYQIREFTCGSDGSQP